MLAGVRLRQRVRCSRQLRLRCGQGPELDRMANAADEAKGWVLVLLHHVTRFHLLVPKHFFPRGAAIRGRGERGGGRGRAHVVDRLRWNTRFIQKLNPVLRIALLKHLLQQALQLSPVGHALGV